MAIIAKDSGGEFELPAEGPQLARCVQVIDLGIQPSNNPKFKPAHKVMLGWEIYPEEPGKQPIIQHKEYTLSLNEKATLGKHLKTWRGRAFTEKELEGFDINGLLDVPCTLAITHRTSGQGKQYASVDGVTKLMKGQPVPGKVAPLLCYEFSMGQRDSFTKLPEWIQKKVAQGKAPETSIADALEPKAPAPAAPAPESGTDDEDDVPF